MNLRDRWQRRRARKAVKEATTTVRASRSLLAEATVRCPRCRRNVVDRDQPRNAHRQSCVRIPGNRPAGWGVKAPK